MQEFYEQLRKEEEKKKSKKPRYRRSYNHGSYLSDLDCHWDNHEDTY